MSHEFIPPFFMGACAPEEADIALFGVCWDGTSSFKAGSRFAGFAVREASFGMEEFSFYQQESLLEIKYTDYGDLFLPPGQKDRALADIASAVAEVRSTHSKSTVDVKSMSIFYVTPCTTRHNA